MKDETQKNEAQRPLTVEEKIRRMDEFLISRGLPPTVPGNKSGSVIIVRPHPPKKTISSKEDEDSSIT